MIISASRRTDIPAFYAPWMINRLQAGFVLVRNPMNARQVSKVRLDPTLVDGIVYWTKDPRPMLPVLAEMEAMGYWCYFQYTLNPYGPSMEPGVPPLSERVAAFRTLAETIGEQRVMWRYDPIILTPTFTKDYHQDQFGALATALKGYTRRCTISFVDQYAKTRRNTRALSLQPVEHTAMEQITRALQSTAKDCSIRLDVCAEALDLSALGVSPARCVDSQVIEEGRGVRLKVGKDRNQRLQCGCSASIDIGAYNCCGHGCLYCYANTNPAVGQKNRADHDPNNPLLLGTIGPSDVVKERAVQSLITETYQTRLDLENEIMG